MAVEVKRGVKKPHPYNYGTSKYPFATMVVGDSFQVPIAAGDTADKAIGRMRSIASHYLRTHPQRRLKFSVMRVFDEMFPGEVVAIGVWAVSRSKK